MFACLIILLYSTSVLAIPNGRTQVTYPSLETLRSGIKILKLRAFDQDIELRLEPAGDVISDDYAIMDEEGNIEAIDVKSLKEKLFRDQNRVAALYINEDGLIEIDGILNSKLRIKPSGSQDVRFGMKEHLITERTENKKRFRDSVKRINSERQFSQKMATNSDKDESLEFKYIVIAEKNFTKVFPDTDKFKETVATAFVQVQNMLDTLELNIKTSGLGSLIMKADPPFITNSIFTRKDVYNIDLLKSNMKMFLCDNKDEEYFMKSDLIMFISGKEYGILEDDGTILPGLAGESYIGGTSTACSKFALIKWDEDLHETAVTMTEEIAHLLGSPFDGESCDLLTVTGSPGSENCPSSDGFLMGDNFGENEEKFSKCSRENIAYYLSLLAASAENKQSGNKVL